MQKVYTSRSIVNSILAAAESLQVPHTDAGLTVLQLVGELDFAWVQQVHLMVDEVAALRSRVYCIDFDEVHFMDSSAVREIMRLVAAVWRNDGRTVMINLHPRVRRAFSLVNAAQTRSRPRMLLETRARAQIRS